MATPLSARQLLEREYLELRASLLSLAASFDRIDRAQDDAAWIVEDPRWQRLQQAIEILQQPGPGRAEQLQMLFSLPYREDWRTAYQLTSSEED